MASILSLNLADVRYACKVISQNPGRYGKQARLAAERTTTTGRYKQRRLAAGRDAIAECLLALDKRLRGDYRKLTAALRSGAIAEGKTDADWNYINELGAQALGLPSEIAQ